MVWVTSLFFAFLMIVTSLIIADREYSQNITFLLIMVWLIPFFYFTKKIKK